MIGQPAEHDRPRITCTGQRDFVERRSHPSGQQRLLLGRKLFGILWRHLAQSQLFLHSFPDVSVLLDLLQRIESLQIKFAFLLLGRMTGHAIVAQQRPNRLVERIRGKAVRGKRCQHRNHTHRRKRFHDKISFTSPRAAKGNR